MELKQGDKYLTIKLVGHEAVAAFKNKNKQGNQPDYKGNGIAVWISTKKEAVKKVEEVDMSDL